MIQLEQHQAEAVPKAVDLLKKFRIAYLRFWMRKGKTLTSLATVAEYFKGFPGIHILFVSEKSALSSIDSDYKEFNPEFQMTAINYASLHKIVNQIKAGKLRFHLVIVDEAHRISKFPKPAIAVDQLKFICQNLPIIYLSATMTPESYSQVYHQFAISTFSPFKQWPTFYRWADKFVNKIMEEYKGLPVARYHDCRVKELEPYMNHLFITVGQEEGKQMLPVKQHFLFVDMSPKAIEIYHQIRKHKIYIDERGRAATANSGAEKRNKLIQIASGTLLFNESIQGAIYGEGEIIDTTKADFIRNYFFGRKIAILYRYKAEGRMLKMFFPNWTESPEEFNTNNHLTFVRQLRSTKTGVNLSSADDLVMFNIEESNEIFIQSMARIQSMYREKPANVWWIFSKHGLEQTIYIELNNKKSEFINYHYA